ncbi:MAG: aminopeptidase N, partial [Methylophaga sp.]
MNAPLVPQTIRLTDYQPPAYLVDSVALHFALDPAKTIVTSQLQIRRNPEGSGGELKLDGEQLQLIDIKLDGKTLAANEFQRSDSQLMIPNVPEA